MCEHLFIEYRGSFTMVWVFIDNSKCQNEILNQTFEYSNYNAVYLYNLSKNDVSDVIWPHAFSLSCWEEMKSIGDDGYVD